LLTKQATRSMLPTNKLWWSCDKNCSHYRAPI